MLINQVLYDVADNGSEPEDEWIELINPTDQRLMLDGWSIRDGKSVTVLPRVELAANTAVRIAASASAPGYAPAFDGQWIVLNGRIGNGLGNSGDALVLSDSTGQAIDALSWGNDEQVFSPAVELSGPGTPLVRRSGVDTDTAADWTSAAADSPAAVGPDQR